MLVSALLPMRLCELLPRVGAVTDMLNSFDSAKRPRQVERFRTESLRLRAAVSSNC
jgi:hypothetical protein